MPWAICILIINNFEGTKCVLNRCSLEQAAGRVSPCLGGSCWPSLVRAVEVLGQGWFVPGWGHSMELTAFSCGSLWPRKESMGWFFAYFKPNGHSPEASQSAGDIILSWHSPPSKPATCSLTLSTEVPRGRGTVLLRTPDGNLAVIFPWHFHLTFAL